MVERLQASLISPPPQMDTAAAILSGYWPKNSWFHKSRDSYQPHRFLWNQPHNAPLHIPVLHLLFQESMVRKEAEEQQQ